MCISMCVSKGCGLACSSAFALPADDLEAPTTVRSNVCVSKGVG